MNPPPPLLHSKIFMDPPRESHIGAWVTVTTQEPKSNTIVPDGSGKHFEVSQTVTATKRLKA